MTRLDIHSDVVCPWCYLGAANLLKALGERDGHPFAIRWHPFQLDPTIPPEGLDRAAYMRAKFGDDGRIEAAHARLAAMGREAGIVFRFDRIARAPNTLDAHRLIRWAEPQALQTRTAMALFRRYFEDGEDISDPAVLARPPRRRGSTAAPSPACSPATPTATQSAPRRGRRPSSASPGCRPSSSAAATPSRARSRPRSGPG